MRRTAAATLAAGLLLTACGKQTLRVTTEAEPDPQTPSTVECEYPTAGAGTTVDREVERPPRSASTAVRYATLETNKGDIVVELDAAAAPCTVNSFASLARQKFYDDTFCHRVLDEAQAGYRHAIVQCGDPSGTGSGGPGYRFADENLEGAEYRTGVVAMANSGRDTNGSQFFMMYDDSDFSPDYAPFGRILSGVEVLQQVADGGRDYSPSRGGEDVPKIKLVFERVTISDARPTATPTASPTGKPSASASPTGTSSATATPTADPSAEPSETATPVGPSATPAAQEE